MMILMMKLTSNDLFILSMYLTVTTIKPLELYNPTNQQINLSDNYDYSNGTY